MLQKVYWGCWIGGALLVLLSRQGIVSPDVGWAGFYVACGAAIVSRIPWPARRAPSAPSTSQKVYELFIETLEKCSRRSGILELPDGELERALFDDCAVGIHSSLHENSLTALRDAGYINDDVVVLAGELLEKWTALERTARTADAVRNDPRWHDLFAMCDRLLEAAQTALERPEER